MKSIFLWFFITASATPTFWQRHVLSAKGESFDTPQAHPLTYFTSDPFSRDDADEFCSVCTPDGKATVHFQHRFKTEVRKVGTLHGFAIFDVFYCFDDHVDSKEIDWKSILVEVSPGQFREIYHLQPLAAQIRPSFLLKVSSERILATSDLIPGTGNYSYEDYFWFSHAGPSRIDFQPIRSAAQSILPADFGIWKGGGLDLLALRYYTPVWRQTDANCCPTGGSVDVRFRIDDGRIVITKKQYDPTPEPVD
jgi:hypothetical protein